MTAKHIGFGMCAAGAACVAVAYRMESKSSFDGGWIVLQIPLCVIGGVLFVAGVTVAIFV